MLPVGPGPVLLAETDAPSEIVTDCPAVREMLPPAPESGAVPIVRLKMPTGVPSLRVPESEIVSVAWIVISPPCPEVLVPLLICPPVLSVSDPVVMEMFPASPHGPEHFPPIVRVKIPLGWIPPSENNGSGAKEPVSPDIEIKSVALIVTLPP